MTKRRKAITVVLALACVGLVAAEPTAAQDGDGHRGGVWLSGGLGTGFDEEIDWGGSGYFRLGGTLGSNVLLGGEVLALSIDQGDVTRTRTNVTATALFHPSTDGPFFLKAGLGVATQEASAEVEGVTVSVSDEAFATTLGMGYEMQLGSGNLFLTPNLDALLQIPDMEISATDASFLLTVGIGFR
jgi:hypothetical protein